MKQISLGAADAERKTNWTRKRVFLDEMNLVVPWSELVKLIAPHTPKPGAKGDRPHFPVETMLRLHFLQQWLNLSDTGMEVALCDTPMFRGFAGLDAREDNLPDDFTILRFRYLLEVHNLSVQIMAKVNDTQTVKGLLLKQGTVVDAILIAAPSSTKKSTGTREPEMHQTKKGNQWHHGMKAHIGADANFGLAYSEPTAMANAHDIMQAHARLHGEETEVFADSGYRDVEKREVVQVKHPEVNWHVAMMPGERRVLDKSKPKGEILEKLEKTKASMRAKLEQPFRVIKRQFGYVKVKNRGLGNNTANLMTLFELSNQWMASKPLLNMGQRLIRSKPA